MTDISRSSSSAALRPHLLAPDNFTPPARTPWGGRRIMTQYKAALGLPRALAEQAVGESWELSFGPELPSKTSDGIPLHELIATDLAAHLGDEASRGSSALLVKWLDAEDDLSVQIHPGVDDPGLAPDETGKPECWYITAAAQGAGVYLGLQSGIDAAAMRSALERGADVSQLLRFQPATPGDFFLLPPGLPHAVGRGVTLVEPQYVMPGKKAVTLRYWDWNRRYDAQGRRDPTGSSRELHVERALDVTDWLRASDPTWLAQQRTSLGAPQLHEAARCQPLCGPTGAPVESPYLRAARLSGSGAVRLPTWGTLGSLRGLTVIDGSVTLRGPFGSQLVARGVTAVIAAGLGALDCQLDQAHAILSSVVAS
ncbi:MAG: type I phosphomannose isomerase catalytic subunit [Polyangiales bacterium]